jgi:hypothetical protein
MGIDLCRVEFVLLFMHASSASRRAGRASVIVRQAGATEAADGMDE